MTEDASVGALHHVELRVADLDASRASWGWLLGELGYTTYQQWDGGHSWILGQTYIVLEQSERTGAHDRRTPGLSHLAFHAGDRDDVDRLWSASLEHRWRHLYADRHPYAGGEQHYAAYLENTERFKVELVAKLR